MLDELNAVNRRAWSIVGFVFWDFNRDGIINSKDLFDFNYQRRKKLKMKKYLTQSKYHQNHYQIKNKVRLKNKDQKRNKMRYILKYYRILNRWKEP